jgi:16S rRNA (cytosine967-C5)-methyltransferase
MSPARTSREVAVEVLHRVDADRAFSGALLHRELERAALSAADAALATELTLGTLRHRAEVDWVLSQFTRTPLSRLPSRIRAVLRTGAYQLMFLDRIPPWAACAQSVEMTKRFGHAGTAPLVNAVLRRIASSPVQLPRDEDTPDGIALCYSHPLWLVRRWVERFGVEETRALCRANNSQPPSAVRLNPLRGGLEAAAAALRAAGVRTAPSILLPEGARIVESDPQARRSAYTAGWFVPQDEGSMLVARLLDPRPGETIIDACAGSGGKTTHLAALMANRGRIVACDVVPAKLAAIDRQCRRLGATIVEPRCADARRLAEAEPGGADGVLVDAPCSGLGVIRRRPEIKWRLSADRLPALAVRQGEILDGAATAVRPGGRLVFAVCTIEPEEGPAVAARFLRSQPDFEPLPIAAWPPGVGGAPPPPAIPGSPGTAFLWPPRHDTDGFFAAAFRRRL